MAARKKTTRKKAQAKKNAPVKANGKGTGAAALVRDDLRAGKTVETIEAEVKKACPSYKFVNGTYPFSRTVTYYQRELEKKGETVKTKL